MGLTSIPARTVRGEYPRDWLIRSIGEIAKPVRGGSPRPAGDKRFFDGSFIPWLTVAALTNIPSSQLFVTNTASALTEDGAARSRTLFPGTLIIANSGATLGVAKILGIKCCANDGIAALLHPSSAISVEYLAHYINSRTSYLREVVATGNGQPNLNTTLIGSLRVPFPPTRAEQDAIAEALSDADAFIESLEQLIAKKRLIKQGAMQELLTGKRRLPGFTGTWDRKQFGDLVRRRRQHPNPQQHELNDFCVELEHIDQGTGTLLGSTTMDAASSLKSVFQPGDVLFGKLRAYLRKYWIAERSGVCSTEIWVLVAQHPLLPSYLFQLVQTERFIETASTAYGTHMPRSDWNAVKTFEVFLPPPDEQSAIADVLASMEAEIAALVGNLSKLRAIKEGMMHELLTGRIRLVRQKPRHNWAINEAVVLGVLAKHFGSEAFPLARQRRTKLAYLLHRHVERRAEGFRKMAAGPYNSDVRYKAEPIARKNQYVLNHHNGRYAGFVAGPKADEAEAYFGEWYGSKALKWLDQFRNFKLEVLELLTTVDMAAEELRRAGQPVEVASVRELISQSEEWRPKLDRKIFSDKNIARAIEKSRELFGEES